MKPSSANS